MELDFADDAEQAFDRWFDRRNEVAVTGPSEEDAVAKLLVKRGGRTGVGAERAPPKRAESVRGRHMRRDLEREAH